MNKKRKKGKLAMLSGVILILAALSLTGYNTYTEKMAEIKAESVFSLLGPETEESNQETADYKFNPYMEMPRKKIDGKYYVGKIYISELGIKLPVMEEWSEENFRTAPCVYKGTPYLKDFIIAAHNYKKQFGPIRRLRKGSKVTFKDMDGNTFRYEVIYTEIIDEKDVSRMEEGEWDLTLFTCNFGGRERITVRCKLTD